MAKQPLYIAYRNGILGPQYWTGTAWNGTKVQAKRLSYREWEALILTIPKVERLHYGYLPI